MSAGYVHINFEVSLLETKIEHCPNAQLAISQKTDFEMAVLLLVGFSLVLYIAYFYWNVRRYPKGPFPIPFLGNLPQVILKEQV